MRRLSIRIFFLFLLSFFLLMPTVKVLAEHKPVFYVKIDSEITKGLYEYLQRAVDEAEENGAELIVFEMDTPGGFVDTAVDIGDLLTKTKIKTVTFINPDAISAGAYIALNTDHIYMSPNGNMGAAEVINQDGTAADRKAQSYWNSKMRDAAERAGKDPIYGLAMIDESIDLPEYEAPKGKLLTLTAKEAVEVGYADGIVQSRTDLLKQFGYTERDVQFVDKTFAEKLAEFITNPIVVPILLSIASLGLILELYSPGFGIPGYMGIVSLLLFFYGHFVAGLAGYESIILFVIGIVLIIVEIFIPGGIVGLIGLGSIFLSILVAGNNVVEMSINLLFAITVGIVAMVILMKFFGKKMTLFNKIVLRDSTSTEQGYVSNPTRTDLIDKIGTTITPLRPSGTILIGNERIDAVTEGGFIGSGKKIIVIEVEGPRVVVREYQDET
ncbi:NfeD family protein [Fervidibacillus halotolerans]|uniref:Nodulation protein NfeD n=1 Tax=Fervidibacillus halotolerans TaxID=2980027 RepID=A0A9E8LYV0_9BACI|nr:nodulation protein NfeD [Fervidibacillus halotolerans]WAA11501.1 nodulation protein NfeD [Fervidibacillus halotolerans]